MDGSTFGIIGLVVVNIGLVAYSYGKLTEKVKDLSDRVIRIEQKINKTGA